MEAVGFYFDRLTALRGLKVKFVAEHAGVKPGYVSRLISRDIKEPSAAVLKALCDAVGGSWEDVGALLDAHASRSHAEALAEVWYTKITQGSGADRSALKQRLLLAIDDLLDDPDERQRVLRR